MKHQILNLVIPTIYDPNPSPFILQGIDKAGSWLIQKCRNNRRHAFQNEAV